MLGAKADLFGDQPGKTAHQQPGSDQQQQRKSDFRNHQRGANEGPRRAPVLPREPSFRVSLTRVLAIWIAGARPKTTPVTQQTSNVKPTTTGCNPISFIRGSSPSPPCGGRITCSRRSPPSASSNPTAPPANASNKLSVSNWRTMRHCPRRTPREWRSHGCAKPIGQQQIGHVDAGNQQHKPHRAHQQHQRGTNVPTGSSCMAETPDSTGIRIRVLTIQPLHDRLHFGLGLLAGDLGFKRPKREPSGLPVIVRGRKQSASTNRIVGWCRIGKSPAAESQPRCKASRRLNALAQNRPVAGKAALPNAITQNHHFVAPAFLLPEERSRPANGFTPSKWKKLAEVAIPQSCSGSLRPVMV